MSLLSEKNISPKENYKSILGLKDYGKIYNNNQSAFNDGLYTDYMIMDNNSLFAWDPLTPSAPKRFKLFRKPGVASFSFTSQGIYPIYANSYIVGVVQQVQDTTWVVNGPVVGVEIFVDTSQNPPYIMFNPIMT